MMYLFVRAGWVTLRKQYDAAGAFRMAKWVVKAKQPRMRKPERNIVIFLGRGWYGETLRRLASRVSLSPERVRQIEYKMVRLALSWRQAYLKAEGEEE
jgi:hypothetical protein